MNKDIIHFQSDKGDSGGISNYISLLVRSKTLLEFRQKVVVKEINKKCLMLYPNQELIKLDTEYGFHNLIYKVLNIKKILDNNQFYIINSHALRAGLLAALIKLFYGKKFLHTNHGLRFTQKKGLKKFCFLLIEIFILILTEEYICIRNSDYILIKKILPKKLFRKKIKIIKLYLDIKNNISNIDSTSKFQSPFKIYGIGSLIEVKNPKKFIDWILILRKNNIKFEASWIGDGKLKNELIEYSKNKQLNINWLGHLDKKDVYKHLSKATYLMQTSLYEVYPTVVLESFHFGTPVISTNYFGVDELINDFKNGVILYENKFDEIKITSMFKNKNKYLLMSNYCRNQFVNFHENHKITAKFYQNIYKKFAS
tara:strand:+ start:1460 stop:2566 length:1107 start_codon:yes stop_codon:yes gene_type:complete